MLNGAILNGSMLNGANTAVVQYATATCVSSATVAPIASIHKRATSASWSILSPATFGETHKKLIQLTLTGSADFLELPTRKLAGNVIAAAESFGVWDGRKLFKASASWTLGATLTAIPTATPGTGGWYGVGTAELNQTLKQSGRGVWVGAGAVAPIVHFTKWAAGGVWAADSYRIRNTPSVKLSGETVWTHYGSYDLAQGGGTCTIDPLKVSVRIRIDMVQGAQMSTVATHKRHVKCQWSTQSSLPSIISRRKAASDEITFENTTAVSIVPKLRQSGRNIVFAEVAWGLSCLPMQDHAGRVTLLQGASLTITPRLTQVSRQALSFSGGIPNIASYRKRYSISQPLGEANISAIPFRKRYVTAAFDDLDAYTLQAGGVASKEPVPPERRLKVSQGIRIFKVSASNERDIGVAA